MNKIVQNSVKTCKINEKSGKNTPNVEDSFLPESFNIAHIITALEKERDTFTMEQPQRYFDTAIDAVYALKRYLHGE